MILLKHKSGSHQVIDRAPASFEARECSLIDISHLSESMLKAIKCMAEHKAICRYPGGCWQAPRGYEKWMRSLGTRTVEALVRRGLAEYTEWKEGRSGRFPVRCELRPDIHRAVTEDAR